MGKKQIDVIDQYYENKYAVKEPDDVKALIESFKDVVISDWQLNDVQADSETYRIKQLVCTCQMLANLADDTNKTLSCLFTALTCRY